MAWMGVRKAILWVAEDGIPAGAFQFTVNTNNTSAGSTAATHMKLPLESGGTYSFTVDWGDGNEDTITAWDDAAVDHTYSSAGTYTVTITGTLNGWRFINTGDRLKILNVAQWGSVLVGNSNGYFYGCSNLTSNASDILDVSSITDFSSFFRGCSNFNGDIAAWDVSGGTNFSHMFRDASVFNQDIGGWDTSSATDMSHMFRGASVFDQDISSWDVSGVTTLVRMFSDSGFDGDLGSWDVAAVTNASSMMNNISLSTSNYDSLLIGWDALELTDSVVFDAGGSTYSAGAAATARASIISTDSWTISDGGLA